MNENIKCTNIRFNMDNPIHKKAWEYLQAMDKTQFKSYTFATAIAVTEYFDRYYKLQDDPYFENRQREEQFAEQIVKAVESVLKDTLPQFDIVNILLTTDTVVQTMKDLIFKGSFPKLKKAILLQLL